MTDVIKMHVREVIQTGGGTTVIANPTLEGDEDDLTGLQVGDTKYKVPGGGSAAWGNITGILSDQTDLQNALDEKISEAQMIAYIDANVIGGAD